MGSDLVTTAGPTRATISNNNQLSVRSGEQSAAMAVP